MCLTYIDHKETKRMQALEKPIKAWKVLWRRWTGEVRGPCHSFVFHTGKNVDEKRRHLSSSLSGETYKAGFHCFKTRKDAEEYKDIPAELIVHVLVNPKTITAVGKQNLKRVIVAREIEILDEI